MVMHEFDLIQHFFAHQLQPMRTDVVLGIGDDCAITTLPPGHELALSIDTLVAGIHFPDSATAEEIGHKALAVNLSDLAAVGAAPAWVTLALTLPRIDEVWLALFAQGFFTLAQQYQTVLIGGDLTRGPLTISIQAHGFIPAGQAITRSHAKPGDLIYVTNTLGDAGLALHYLQQKIDLTPQQMSIMQRLHKPMPRIAEGIALRNIANAMIDVSDGLAADLSHILTQSNVSATIHLERLPLSATLRQAVPLELAYSLALTAGDDYELCFTAPKNKQSLIKSKLKSATCIGEIRATKQHDPHQLMVQLDGKPYFVGVGGYQHF
jgi:thiamine-monophosphate kinase